MHLALTCFQQALSDEQILVIQVDATRKIRIIRTTLNGNAIQQLFNNLIR